MRFALRRVARSAARYCANPYRFLPPDIEWPDLRFFTLWPRHHTVFENHFKSLIFKEQKSGKSIFGKMLFQGKKGFLGEMWFLGENVIFEGKCDFMGNVIFYRKCDFSENVIFTRKCYFKGNVIFRGKCDFVTKSHFWSKCDLGKCDF